MNKELSDLKKFLKSAGFSSEYNYLNKISQDVASGLPLTTDLMERKNEELKTNFLLLLEKNVSDDPEAARKFVQSGLEAIEKSLYEKAKEEYIKLNNQIVELSENQSNDANDLISRSKIIKDIFIKMSDDNQNNQDEENLLQLLERESAWFISLSSPFLNAYCCLLTFKDWVKQIFARQDDSSIRAILEAIDPSLTGVLKAVVKRPVKFLTKAVLFIAYIYFGSDFYSDVAFPRGYPEIESLILTPALISFMSLIPRIFSSSYRKNYSELTKKYNDTWMRNPVWKSVKFVGGKLTESYKRRMGAQTFFEALTKSANNLMEDDNFKFIPSNISRKIKSLFQKETIEETEEETEEETVELSDDDLNNLNFKNVLNTYLTLWKATNPFLKKYTGYENEIAKILDEVVDIRENSTDKNDFIKKIASSKKIWFSFFEMLRQAFMALIPSKMRVPMGSADNLLEQLIEDLFDVLSGEMSGAGEKFIKFLSEKYDEYDNLFDFKSAIDEFLNYIYGQSDSEETKNLLDNFEDSIIEQIKSSFSEERDPYSIPADKNK